MNRHFLTPWGDLEQLFWTEDPRRKHKGSEFLNPRYEVTERPEDYLLSLDMPGVKKEDIKLEVKESHLLLEASRHTVERDDEHYSKLSGTYKREFQLPNDVETENVDAKFENGVLTLKLPKKLKAVSREIQING